MFIALYRHQMFPRHNIEAHQFFTLSLLYHLINKRRVGYSLRYLHICYLLNRYWFNYYLTKDCSIQLDFKFLHIAIKHFIIEQQREIACLCLRSYLSSICWINIRSKVIRSYVDATNAISMPMLGLRTGTDHYHVKPAITCTHKALNLCFRITASVK